MGSYLAHSQVEENECCILFLLAYFFQSQEKIDFKMFAIRLDGKTLKTLLLQILVTKMFFEAN